MSFFTGAIKVLGPAIRFLFCVKEVKGVENIPSGQGMLVCANHTSFADPIIVIAAMRTPIRFMAKAELFKIPLLNLLIKAFGAFPVTRGGTDVGSLKNTVKLIKEENLVGMFPQGTRCPGVPAESTQVKSGAGLIVSRAECPVLPVYLKTKKNKTGFFRRTTVIIGKPIQYDEMGIKENVVREYESASEYVFKKICALNTEEA